MIHDELKGGDEPLNPARDEMVAAIGSLKPVRSQPESSAVIGEHDQPENAS